MGKIKIGNPKTINRLIEIAMDISEENNNPNCKRKYGIKYGRRDAEYALPAEQRGIFIEF